MLIENLGASSSKVIPSSLHSKALANEEASEVLGKETTVMPKSMNSTNLSTNVSLVDAADSM